LVFGRSKVLDVGEITERKETHMTVSSITIGEALEHASANWERTDGMVAGGSYIVEFEDLGLRLVHVKVLPGGVAIPAYWEPVTEEHLAALASEEVAS
jgi:hypothetical protein